MVWSIEDEKFLIRENINRSVKLYPTERANRVLFSLPNTVSLNFNVEMFLIVFSKHIYLTYLIRVLNYQILCPNIISTREAKKRVLILGKGAYYGKYRILHLRYSLYLIESCIRIGLFVYNFRKKIFWLKKCFYDF